MCTATLTSFWTISDEVSSSIPHLPCGVLYCVTMLIGCWTGACNPMLCPFWGLPPPPLFFFRAFIQYQLDAIERLKDLAELHGVRKH